MLRRLRSDTGSVLMLMPFCVVIVLILASLAVDMAAVHLRQRQAFSLAAAAANDAATGGADPNRLRAGSYDLSRSRVHAVVDEVIAASELAPHLVEPPRVSINGITVEVELSVRAAYIFTAALPARADGTVVTASASAAAVPGN